ncbi:hypothetical protein HNQ79_005568 [Streptomyces candidus]|uniref:Uncharacterized protein n=1 Tax=Streptomyces candidus TaxID=67283 RepID=A0A7X0HJZ6_9ACTN|nr:hypothetical protein [Streptomyces candidus]GHH55476.1 hypothetical protein GCM10018773_59960 [Streptomyces candidus]
MDPVTVGAAVTVALSVVSGIVRIAQRRLAARVELARITETGLTDRTRCLTGSAVTPAGSRPGLGLAAHERCGGDRRGGRAQH